MGAKIYFLTTFNPFDINTGGCVYSRNLYRAIRGSCDAKLDILCANDVEKKEPRKTMAKVWALLVSILCRAPILSSYISNQSFVGCVKGLNFNANDVVFIDHSELFVLHKYLPDNIKIITVFHNIEHRLQKMKGRGLAKLFVNWDARKLKALEDYAVEKSDHCIFLSSKDAENYSAYADKATVVPPFFNYQIPGRCVFKSTEKVVLGFIGPLSWWPNKEAVEWALNELVYALPGNAELHFYGVGTEELSGPKIVGHGFVEKIEDFWGEIDVLFAPILNGSGVSIKIAEAVFHGVPVLTTKTGARGVQSELLHIFSHKDDVLDCLREILNKYENQQRCTSNLYDSEHVSSKISEIIN